MKWSLVCTLFIAAVSIVLLAAAPGAGKAPDAPQKFNLADLASGETRTFGEGDHAITATRRGDDIEVTFKSDGGKSRKQTLHCTVGKDSCYAYAVSKDGEGHMVVLSKTAASGKEGEEKEITKVILTDAPGDEKEIMVFAADGEDGEHVVIKSGDQGMTWVTGDGADAKAGVNVIRISDDAGTMLRCPEGDATLTLKKGEEGSGPYFCPRHNLKMEPVKGKVVIKKIEVDTKSKGEEH